MRTIDLYGRFKYDPAVHTDDDMRHAVNHLFATVYTDLVAGCSKRDLNKHFESVSLPAFVDLLGDTLSDCKVPSEKIDEIQAWCRSRGREPNRLDTNAPPVFTFKGYTR